MYSEYWNLVKPPFDNVPDSSMYVDCHVSMEDTIAETIYAIKEGNECLTVIVGEVGLGKTLSLRVIIDSLEPEKYKVALITNPALSFIQLLREIIGQITGKQCLEKKKVDLLEMFNRLLFETADQGKKIVVVIDEANVLSSSNLDDLRLLTNMQDDDRNLFTLLLVGQMELAHRLEQPKRANLFQRIGTYGHLEKLPSKEAVRDYIEARLKIAGTQQKIFDDNAISIIWEFSEHGVPRLINKICKLCLKAGETNEFKSISGDVASQIADRFQKLGKTRKAPGRPEAESSGKSSDVSEGVKVPKPPRESAPPRPVSRMEGVSNAPPLRDKPPARMEQPRVFTPERPPVQSAPPPREEAPVRMEQPTVVPVARPNANYVPLRGGQSAKSSATSTQTLREDAPARTEQSKAYMPEQTVTAPIPPRQEARAAKEIQNEPYIESEQEIYEEVMIGQQKVKLSIPSQAIRQAQSANSENKNKLAGYWSAQILKGNPQIMSSSLADPVSMWFEVKNVILKKFESSSKR